MAMPSETVPRPSGRPCPSGRTSMSQAATSSGVATRPMPSLPPAAASEASCAVATMAVPNSNPAAKPSLRNLDILDHSVGADMPGLDAIVVVDGIGAAHRAQFLLGRLHEALVVDGARLQEKFRAVPVELVVEAVQCHGQARPVDARRVPIAAAIDGDVDPADGA